MIIRRSVLINNSRLLRGRLRNGREMLRSVGCVLLHTTSVPLMSRHPVYRARRRRENLNATGRPISIKRDHGIARHARDDFAMRSTDC